MMLVYLEVPHRMSADFADLARENPQKEGLTALSLGILVEAHK